MSLASRTRIGLLVFSACLALPGLAHADAQINLAKAPAPSKSAKSGKAYFRLLSYNVKGLPSLINPYKKGRFPIIAKILADRRKNGSAPDVVLIQESFIKPSAAINKLSGYPYASKGPDAAGVEPNGRKFSKLLNGGIYILSEYPFKKTARFNFPSNSCGSFDCFSNKGGQYVSIRLPGVPFDLQILNTHSQSAEKFEEVRFNQFAWLNYFMRSNVNYEDPYRAVIFGGDFNAKGHRKTYSYFRDLAEMTSAAEVCLSPKLNCEIMTGTKPEWLLADSNDQVFYASGKKVRIRPLEIERNFTEKYKGKFLSDHLGYEVLFEITWQ